MEIIPSNNDLLAADIGAGRAYVEQDPRAARTLVEYGKRWAIFNTWCTARALRSVPAEPGTVATARGWPGPHPTRATGRLLRERGDPASCPPSST